MDYNRKYQKTLDKTKQAMGNQKCCGCVNYYSEYPPKNGWDRFHLNKTNMFTLF